jgi:hypothetical protein
MLIIWNLEDGSEEQTISVAFNGPVTSAAWISDSLGTPNEAFAFGTADGNLFIYAYRTVCFKFSQVGYLLTIGQNYYDFAFSTVAHNGVIEDIAFDTIHKRLATVGTGCMKLWEIGEKCKGPLSPPIVLSAYLCPVVAWNFVTTPPKSSIARCVSFLDEGRDILVGYLDSHEVYAF